MIPTTGKRRIPVGVGSSTVSPRLSFASCGQIFERITPVRPAEAVHRGFVTGDHVALHAARHFDRFERDQHHRQAPELDSRHTDRLHVGHAGNVFHFMQHRCRKMRSVRGDILRGGKEQIGVQGVVHPLLHRIQTTARHSRLADYQGEREHERGHGRRGSPGRLNQAVRRQRAFHGKQPAQRTAQQASPGPAPETE